MDDAFDKYHKAKQPKHLRERSFQDTLVKDAKLKTYVKRKFGEIQKSKQSGGKKQYKQKLHRKRRGRF